MHIAISGNIGAGKTTLTGLLSKHFGWEANYESVENNPYLNDFYSDMVRWSFNLQIFYLNTRFAQIMEIKKKQNTIIQDRTIYEDAYIFAPNLYNMGLMTKKDFENYFNLFTLLDTFVPAPDIVIYLKANTSKLMNNINLRGRDYENNISVEYLQNLNNRYNDWASNYTNGKLLIIDVNDLNFIDNNNDFISIVKSIENEIARISN